MLACNYDGTATEECSNCCDYPEEYYDCEGVCLIDSDGDGVCEELEVEGCMDMEACNYDDEATDACDACCNYETEFCDCDGEPLANYCDCEGSLNPGCGCGLPGPNDCGHCEQGNMDCMGCTDPAADPSICGEAGYND